MLQVSQLFIYPIKSLAGIELAEAQLTDRGFEHDRRWMLIDDQNRFLTQREFPQMALLQPALTPENLVVSHKQTGTTINIPLRVAGAERFEAVVWDDTCVVEASSPDINDWFSQQLQFSCQLVSMPNDSHRKVDGRYAFDGEITNLGDGYPLLTIGQSSLDDLNGRLAEPLPINRFRPNIVFTGGEPYQEDFMKHFRIAAVDFFGVKPCARCPITTINQNTSERSKEPLKTLATYRRKDNKVYFGQNLLYKGNASIRVGDAIEILEMAASNGFVFD